MIDFIVQRGDFVVTNHGERFRVSFYDRPSAQFYAGSGPTVWIAIALALHERTRRIESGQSPMVARNEAELSLLEGRAPRLRAPPGIVTPDVARVLRTANPNVERKNDGEVSKLRRGGCVGADVEERQMDPDRQLASSKRKPLPRNEERRGRSKASNRRRP